MSKSSRDNSSAHRRVAASLLLAAAALAGIACRQDMQDTPRYRVYRASSFFPDGTSARPLPEGTVPRGFLRANAHLYEGKVALPQASPPSDQTAQGQTAYDPSLATAFPFPVTNEVMQRGRERYEVFCSVCHGLTGDGDGMVVQRGFRKPLPYSAGNLRNAPVGHFFDVISNGWGAMPAYRAQIPVEDRWAIIAYIRALQKSKQGVPLQADAPAAALQPAASSGGHNK